MNSDPLLVGILCLVVCGCAKDEHICVAIPRETVLMAGSSDQEVELVRINNSKKVTIRLPKGLASAHPGEHFRYSNGSFDESIRLKSVDLELGKVVISGLWVEHTFLTPDAARKAEQGAAANP